MISKDVRTQVFQIFDWILSILGFLCFSLLVLLFGFHLTEAQRSLILSGFEIVVVVFVLQEFLRILIERPWLNYFRSRWLELIFAVFLSLSLLNKNLLERHLISSSDFTVSELFLVYLGSTQFLLFFTELVRFIRSHSIVSRFEITPSRILFLSFSLTILVGALALKLPKASVSPISWIDAFFTSTSAVCVTGLASFDVATVLTPFGQVILLTLIQIGGLGIMTLTMSFGLLVAGALGVRERIVLGDLLSEDRIGEVGNLLVKVMLFTFVIEGIGALFLYQNRMGTLKYLDINEVFYAIFHSVSAFCNAGFSIYPQGLLNPQIASPVSYSWVLMVLIVLGGLGFPVLVNIGETLSSFRRSWYLGRSLLKVQTKLVLITTFFLLIFGTFFIWLTEVPGSFSQLSLWEQLRQSAFLSVSSRTAGFNIWPTESLSTLTCILIMTLMWVGGSPMSCAGGIKTLTLAISVLNFKAIVLGQPRIEIFNREIDQTSVQRAFAIILGSIVLVLGAGILLVYVEPGVAPLDLFFEAFSAFGTVGLSRGLTPNLGTTSKLILIGLMFIGRLGIIAFFLSLSKEPLPTGNRFLKETIPIS